MRPLASFLALFASALTAAVCARAPAPSAEVAATSSAAPREPAPSENPRGPTAGPPSTPDPSALTGAPSGGACEVDADCRRPPGPDRRRGRCLTAGLAAQYTQAFARCEDSAAWRDAHPVNRCVYDECNDGESPGGDTCGPGRRCGILEMAPLPVRVCVPAECTQDFQCRREAGGRCAAYLAGARCARGGWACSYPRDVCAPRDPVRMCPQGASERLRYCRPVGPRGRFVCDETPVEAMLPRAQRDGGDDALADAEENAQPENAQPQ